MFEAEYRRIYGLTIPDVGVEVVTWRLSAFADGDAGRAAGSTVGDGHGDAAHHAARPLQPRRAEPVDTPVYRRTDLGVGQRSSARRSSRSARRRP